MAEEWEKTSEQETTSDRETTSEREKTPEQGKTPDRETTSEQEKTSEQKETSGQKRAAEQKETSEWKSAAEQKKTAAVVLAAGQGKRMHSAVAKQFLLLNGKPLIYYSLKAFEKSRVDVVVLVTGQEEISYCQKEIVEKYGFNKVAKVVPGGKERYHSVYAGLSALSDILDADGIALIHDGARPMVTQDIIDRTISAAVRYGACVAAMPVKDTIKVSDERGFAAATPDRSMLWQIQTPQVFSYGLIRQAYEKLLSEERFQRGITDDAMVVEAMTSEKVKLVEGSYENIKVTTPEDMRIAECFLIPEKNGVKRL